MIVISEVKTRSTDYFGPPSSAVGVDKQRRLRRLARVWLAHQPTSFACVRFDVVEVVVSSTSTKLHVIEAAF